MFRKLLILVAISMASATALKAQNNQCPPPCPPCPPCVENYGRGQGLEPIENMQPGYNSPARIDVCGCWDVYLTGSFIYWMPMMYGLTHGYFHDLIDPGNQTSRVFHHDFEYEPGFKVGLGTNLDHDNWDLYFEYTWLYASTTKRHDWSPPGVPGDVTFYGWGDDEGSTTIKKSHAKWDHDINIIDAELARAHYAGTRLIFRPFISARAAWFDHKWLIEYSNVDDDLFYFVKADMDTWLVGPRIGIDGTWIINDGFRLLGNAAGTLAYQYFKTKWILDNGVNIVMDQEKEGYITPIVELGVALAWGSYFNNQNWFFDLQVGYDFQYFWNQNRMRAVNDMFLAIPTRDPNVGDLMLHGLTVTARLDF